MKALDLTGRRFGRLIATARAPHIGKKRLTAWLCNCDCGKQKAFPTEVLTRGLAISCGCARDERVALLNASHGHTKGRGASREYKSWSHAKARCTNPNDPKYPQYGGRGIVMCSEWESSFERFFEDMGTAPEGCTLDRIDVNGNYELGNCRWATNDQQANNRTNNVYVDWEGERITLRELARRLDINYKTLHYIHRGPRKLSLTDSLEYIRNMGMEGDKRSLWIQYEGKSRKFIDIVKEYNLPYYRLHQSIYRDGKEPESEIKRLLSKL